MKQEAVMCVPPIIKLNQLRFIWKCCFMGQCSQIAGYISLCPCFCCALIPIPRFSAGNGEVTWVHFLYMCSLWDLRREKRLTSWYVIILLHIAGEEGKGMISEKTRACTHIHTEREKDTLKANTLPSVNTFLPFTSIWPLCLLPRTTFSLCLTPSED